VTLALAFAAAVAFPRLLGGLSVLRASDRLHLAMGFAAGGMMGVAAFETLPEAIELTGGYVLAAAVAGGLGFALLDHRVFRHVHAEDRACNPRAGEIGAGALSIHAFLDGLAIGASFHISTELGVLVSAAVLVHAFADGLNTVSVLLGHGHGRRKALTWLLIDALSPVTGAAIGLLIALPDHSMGVLLALFAGMFVYLGAGSLLPQAHRFGRDRAIVWLAALSGFALAFGATQLG
jgi:zinc transporter, ZIP family